MTTTDHSARPTRPADPTVDPLSLRLPGGTVTVAGAAATVPALGVRGCDPQGSPGCTGPGSLLHPGDAVPFEPELVLGRRGLRYKDRATLLGAAVAELALREAGWSAATGRSGDGAPRQTGVVVASCCGNLETVCTVAAAIDQEGVPAISPMDLPNASSNVVAATIAIRSRLQGVCLTVCNGHTGGWDAVLWAARLLHAGRAPAVVVVGVETPSQAERTLRGEGPELVDGAAALVLRPADPADPATGTGGHQAVSPPDGAVAAPAVLTGYETASLGGVLDVVAAVQAVREGAGTVTLSPPGPASRTPAVWVLGAR